MTTYVKVYNLTSRHCDSLTEYLSSLGISFKHRGNGEFHLREPLTGEDLSLVLDFCPDNHIMQVASLPLENSSQFQCLAFLYPPGVIKTEALSHNWVSSNPVSDIQKFFRKSPKKLARKFS